MDSVGGLIPVPAQAGNVPRAIAPVTIPAGDPAQSSQGNCLIVDGPYERPGGGTPPLSFGTFNVGSVVTITETSVPPGTTISTVTSPTGTPVRDLPNNRASLTLGFPGGFNEIVFTNVLGGGLESDIGSRPTGDGLLLSNDVVFLRLFAVGLLSPVISPNEFQRADAAPRSSLGDAIITSADVVQARRYVAGLDPPTPAGGPLVPVAPVVVSPLSGLSSGSRTISAFTANSCAGSNSTVAIMIDSEGLEAGAGFTVTFDPAVLTTPAVSLGDDAAKGGFVLTTNLNNVAAGQIGVLLDAQNAFPAGASKRHLVNIHFQVVPGTSANATEVGFSNKTTYLSTSDALGNLLETSYQPSAFVIGGASCNTSTDVSVAGRVLSPQGNGIRNATVMVTDSGGKVRTVLTNSLGYYELTGVRAGQTYVIGVSSKRYRFASRILQPADSLSDIDFVGTE